MRQQVVGNVRAERVPVGGVEGRNDVARRAPAPRSGTRNGNDRRTNRHVPGGPGPGGLFGADVNDPSTRFEHVRAGFSSLDDLTAAITSAIAVPEAPRRIADITTDMERVMRQRDAAAAGDRHVFVLGLTALQEELAATVARQSTELRGERGAPEPAAAAEEEGTEAPEAA